MNANAKRKLLFCLGVLALVAVVCFVLRVPIRVQYHKAAFSLKFNNAHKFIRFGNYLRGKGIHFSWDIDSGHSDRDVDALVQLGYLVKREFAFSPPLSEKERRTLWGFGVRPTFLLSGGFSVDGRVLHVTTTPDDMAVVLARVREFDSGRATNSPTIRSSELPPAVAAGSRSP
jgi:hypothetical protein